jgi:DNA-binding MarR family transcriptional regulator
MEPSAAAQLAWIALNRARDAALARVEARLKAAGLPPLGWYDALLELERAGREGLRPVELERRLLLPQYGLSRLLARLEAEGLVTRTPCPHDARGQVATATAAGRALRRRMWRHYGPGIAEAMGGLTEEEAGMLASLLGKLAA